MPVTVPQTELILLSYFQTSDTPTQDQFEELIRTFYYLAQQAQTSADAAEAAVTAALADIEDRLAHVVGRASTQWAAGNTTTVYRDVGCTIVGTGVAGPGDTTGVLTVTFDDALPDDDYIILFGKDAPASISSKTTGGFAITVTAGTIYEFVVMR